MYYNDVFYKPTKMAAHYDDGKCAICLGPQLYKSIPICGHVFCFRCITDWYKIKMECPLCRQSIESYMSYNLPLSVLHTDGIPRRLSQTPDVLPQVLNIPIDAQSPTMDLFLSDVKRYVGRIQRTHQLCHKKSTVNLIIWNDGDDQYRKTSIINAIKQAFQP